MICRYYCYTFLPHHRHEIHRRHRRCLSIVVELVERYESCVYDVGMIG